MISLWTKSKQDSKQQYNENEQYVDHIDNQRMPTVRETPAPSEVLLFPK